eukprot:6851588-Pyramimonas_sp.AAC.1
MAVGVSLDLSPMIDAEVRGHGADLILRSAQPVSRMSQTRTSSTVSSACYRLCARTILRPSAGLTRQRVSSSVPPGESGLESGLDGA